MYKRELYYTILVFVVFELITVLQNIVHISLLGVLGLILLFAWIVGSITYYSKKKISRFSDVMVRLEVRKRWYTTIFMPLALYLSTFAFINIVKEEFIIQFAIFLGSVALFVLFMNVRSSFEKSFNIEKNTRVVFNVINVVIFFLISSILMWTQVYNTVNLSLIIMALAFLIFLTNAIFVDKLSFNTLCVVLVFGLILGASAYFSEYLAYFPGPFVVTLVFYMLFSIWHIRLSGELKVSKYIEPVLFTMMAMIIVLT